MGRRALDTTLNLIVSVFLVSVLMYFLVYSVANIPVHTTKRELTEENEKPTNSSFEELPLCPIKPPFFITKVQINTTPVDFPELNSMFPELEPGGRFKPKHCRARVKTAVLFPYRDRERNLFLVLRNLIPFMMAQNLEFQIFVVEQVPWYDFNKCIIINIGFKEALKVENFDCFVIHDTDFIPKDYRNLYYCGNQPRHLVVDRSDRAKRGLGYYRYFGGGILVSRDQWESINGCSNMYWGWGNEDDDMYMRFIAEGYTIQRYPIKIGAYLALEHETQTKNMKRRALFDANTKRMHEDGLNTLEYRVVKYNITQFSNWTMVEPAPPSNVTVTFMPPTIKPAIAIKAARLAMAAKVSEAMSKPKSKKSF